MGNNNPSSLSLSSSIFSESFRTGSATYGKQIVVGAERKAEKLSEFVRRIRKDKELSLLDVERQSRQAGEPIAGSYVNRIENDQARAEGITPKKLQALARGLEIPEEVIFAVARGKAPLSDTAQHETLQLAQYYSDLPRECQLDVLALTKALWQRRSRAGRKNTLKDTAQRVKKPREKQEQRDAS